MPENPFPPPESADEDGVVAVGGEPWPELLKLAYPQGIFPWPHRGLPLLWFSPDPRFVLEPGRAHLPASLRKALRRTPMEVRADTRFRDVMRGCQRAYRPGQQGTWITDAMIEGYTTLHEEGIAHSIEAFCEGQLVGGLYGVSFGKVFFGESMFAEAADASKIAFATLLGQLVRWEFPLVDCQSRTSHLARFGATDWPRTRFLEALRNAVAAPSKSGPWQLEVTPRDAAEIVGRTDIAARPTAAGET